MLDIEVTHEVADAIAEIGRVDPRYNSPEGVLFRKALALIQHERNWCQGAIQRTLLDGTIQHCSLGAPYHLSGCDTANPHYMKVFHALFNIIGGNGISEFNDTHTHAEVIAKWHEAGFANGWL